MTNQSELKALEDKEGNKRKATEVVIDQFKLLGGKGEGGAGAPATERYEQESTGSKDIVIEDIDDRPIDLSEIPF